MNDKETSGIFPTVVHLPASDSFMERNFTEKGEGRKENAAKFFCELTKSVFMIYSFSFKTYGKGISAEVPFRRD
jgi:hypothetical protein